MNINTERVEHLLESILDARKNLNEILKTEIAEPVKPNIVEDTDQWYDYVALKKKYDFHLMQLGEGAEKIKKNIVHYNQELINNLPPNTWFLIDGYYVGYETNDWPMDVFKVQIVKKDVGVQSLPILRHRIIN